MNHVMMDDETLGTRPGDAVISIGLVRFDPKAGIQTAEELRKNSLRVTFDLNDLILGHGMKVEPSTLKWWFNQSKEAQQASLNGNELVFDGLKRVQEFFETFYGRQEELVWANGANFDPGMNEELFRHAGLRVPWKYSNVRCYRTINKMFGPKISGDVKVEMYNQGDQKLVAHDPVDDCISQIRILQAIAKSFPDMEWN